MKISEVVHSLQTAMLDVGDIEVNVDWSNGARPSFPILFVVHGSGEKIGGMPYCEIAAGLIDPFGDGDPDWDAMGSEMRLAAKAFEE